MSFFSTTLGKIVKSRTVWGAAVLGAIPVIQAISPIVPEGTKSGAVIAALLGIYTVYCRIQAKQPLGPVIDSTIAKAVDAVHQLQGQPPPTAQRLDAVSLIVKDKLPPASSELTAGR